MESVPGLSPEQGVALDMFGEVTAHALDPSVAVQLLRACDWNVDQALQVHWASGKLLRGATRFVAVVLHVLVSFLFGSGASFPSNTSGSLLSSALTKKYGAQVSFPKFFPGSFAQALQAARQEAKLLVVYLHSDNARHTDDFCTNVLSNSVIRMMVDENFLLWGGDVVRMETHHVAQMVHARQYPCLCVLLPASVDEIRVIGTVHGEVQAEPTVALLTACVDEMETHRAEIIARREQHAEDRSLREDQDREYREALELDRQREEERKAVAAKEREAARLAEEERRAEEARLAGLEAARRETEERRRKAAGALPTPGADAKSKVCLRLPAGQRLERKFCPEATVADVYAWADCLAYLPEHEGRGLVVPPRFMLKTAFPSRDLTGMDSSIKEMELSGAMLLLAEIEEDE